MSPSEMVPAQQLADAGDDLVRLAAAKDAEIAALTKERDRAMKALLEIESDSIDHKAVAIARKAIAAQAAAGSATAIMQFCPWCGSKLPGAPPPQRVTL